MAHPTAKTEGNQVALVTGVGRRIGIGAAVVERLVRDGFDVGFTFWTPYDDRMPWGSDVQTAAVLSERLGDAWISNVAVEADLEDPATPEVVFDTVESSLGPVSVLVLCHCESVDSGILDTTIESFQRHFAVNATHEGMPIVEPAASRR